MPNFSHLFFLISFSSSILLTQAILCSHIPSQKITEQGCKGAACHWTGDWKIKTEVSICGLYLSLEINCLWPISATSYIVIYNSFGEQRVDNLPDSQLFHPLINQQFCAVHTGREADFLTNIYPLPCLASRLSSWRNSSRLGKAEWS